VSIVLTAAVLALTGFRVASNMTPMDFGFAFPGRGPLATPEILTKLARKGGRARYSSIFVTDHVVIPASQSAPIRIRRQASSRATGRTGISSR
jgi:hypothetical protein